jgi:hypothetical protein
MDGTAAVLDTFLPWFTVTVDSVDPAAGKHRLIA